MSNYSILVVDDDPEQLNKVQQMLESGIDSMRYRLGLTRTDTYAIDLENDAGRVIEAIRDASFPYNIIVADIFMPLKEGGRPVAGGGAKRIYDFIKATSSYDEIMLVVMTNRDSEARNFFKEIWAEQSRLQYPWAIEYVKPDVLAGPNRDEKLFEKNLWVYAICRAITKSQDHDWRKSFLRETVYDIFGNDPRIVEAKLKTEQYANESVISLTGETGTGKELFAKRIHYNSNRKANRYLPINCNKAVGLINSEIFGHEKGAFSGAHETRRSIFEQANGGTVFLDEFGADREVLNQLDPKLRRLLREGQFQRVGGSTIMKFTGTIILGSSALTSLQPPDDISNDLHARISTYTIHLPPLRERKQDIEPLAKRFLQEFAGQDIAKSLTPRAIQVLENYGWPENVAELRNKMRLCAQTVMTTTVDEDEILKVLDIAVEERPTLRYVKRQITCEQLIEVMNDPSVNGNATHAAKLLYPEYSDADIRGWKRKDISKLIRLCKTSDPDFESKLTGYRPRGGRPVGVKSL